MKDLSKLLRDGDPAASDAGLSCLETAAMRRLVVDAARGAEVRAGWQRPTAVVAMVALTLAAGVIAGRRLPVPSPQPEAPMSAAATSGVPTQLQFSTPGGTRIIWVFDPEFDLKETIP